ncbi:MAG TPA: hypothetical protein VJM33_14170 [Microthrixaceae bacterium]|nr:hypothetical protein [Microthrixaceae bacterium]
MTSPFDPGLRRLAKVLPRRAVSERNLPVVRVLTHLLDRRPSKRVEVQTAGPVTVRLHRPLDATGRPHPALLWIHGGIRRR